MKRAAAVLAVSAAVLAAGCSSGGGHPSATTTASVSPSIPPAVQLAGEVARARSAQYTASYRLTSSGRSVLLTVSKSSVGLRVDVIAPRNLASVFIVRGSVIACAGPHRTCLLVARPGHPVPSLFRSALTITSFLNPAQFPTTRVRTVTLSGTSPASGSVPAGQCYDVTGVLAGAVAVYCFGPPGVITRAQFGADLLTLTRLRAAPPARTFRPWSSPTPLP